MFNNLDPKREPAPILLWVDDLAKKSAAKDPALYLFSLHETSELLVLTRLEYAKICDTLMGSLLNELCRVEENSTRWIRRWIRENAPSLSGYLLPAEYRAARLLHG